MEATYELDQNNNSLRRQISAMWGSDELRRVKPTPVVRDGGLQRHKSAACIPYTHR